ncbi:WD40 repeat-like protein [Rhizopus microsporus]|uniref:WD40 repeat-like protein n=2 Tax=Rhizopus TaxID=4842 RepID=A0A1X0RR03_RHIZD|nr:WD40 repeat-like protein [Rhizopus microsporus]
MSNSSQGEQDQQRQRSRQQQQNNNSLGLITLASADVQSPPASVSSFVSLLSQPPRRCNHNNIPNQSLSYASIDRVDDELSCPICQDIMKEVFATKCGHSFCYECISEHIKYQSDCPLCRSRLLAELRIQVMERNIPIFKTDPMEALVRRIKNDHSSIASSIASSLPYSDTFLVRLKSSNDMTIKNLMLQNRYIVADLDILDIVGLTRREDEQQLVDQSTEDVENEENRSTSRARSVFEDVNISTPNENPIVSRMDERFSDLRSLYYCMMNPPNSADLDEDERHSQLEVFSSHLYEIARYGSFDVLDTLHYSDTSHSTSIVSSIEFDKDEEFFAVGGILKDIKIYDFRMTCRPGESRTMMHCPVRRIACENKISCVAWSPYIKGQIASSDYLGVISVWDVGTGQKTASFAEHRKRAWSVDICQTNPSWLASGSDDTTVKVWSLNSPRSIFTLPHKGNICCAKFAPNNQNYLAVGTADHNIICYDLRNPTLPLYTYHGHQKAVSYVKWLNDNELVSAETVTCMRTFTGHLNEKNFVGLSVNENWIACGSETNTVYAYHKHAQAPIAKYTFPIDAIPTRMMLDSDPAYFVSSVCWKKDSSKLLSANSKGVVRVLQLK